MLLVIHTEPRPKLSLTFYHGLGLHPLSTLWSNNIWIILWWHVCARQGVEQWHVFMCYWMDYVCAMAYIHVYRIGRCWIGTGRGLTMYRWELRMSGPADPVRLYVQHSNGGEKGHNALTYDIWHAQMKQLYILYNKFTITTACKQSVEPLITHATNLLSTYNEWYHLNACLVLIYFSRIVKYSS